MKDDLEEAISGLAHAVRALTVRIEVWRAQERCCLAIKADLEQMTEKILMKVSDLKTEFPALKAQIVKISNEQQARFDAQSAKITELEELIRANDPELPAEVNQAFVELKTLTQQLDDTIIDTTAVTP